VSYAGLGGRRTTVTAATNNLTLTGAVRYPRYPSFTFQYAWSDSTFGGAGHTTGTTWLLAGNYDWGPLRFIADQSSQSFGDAGGTGRRSQYGVTYSQSLLPKVEVSIDHLRTNTALEAAGSTLESSGASTTARLTAYPTPAIVLAGEFGVTDGSPGGLSGDAQGRARSRRYSLDVRTEVVPGTRLDVFSRTQSHDSTFGQSTNRELAVDLDTRLGPSTILGAQWNRSRSDFGGSYFQHQEGARLTASSRLGTNTRLHASAGRSRQENERGTSESLTAEVGITHEVGPNLSLSGSYDFLRRRDDQSGEALRDTVHSLMLDARWAPNRQWDVRGGIGITSRRNSESSLSVDPYAELRWSPTYSTTVTVRQYVDYSSERSRDEGAPFVATRAAAGFSARLSHQLSENESVRIGYEESGGLGGTLDAQKMLQANYVRSF
jgi:hypothetical protein